MGTLDGRVAIITGAGRGIGREHALLFAAEGAKVVVNDLGGANDGTGADVTPAQQVVDEIQAMGGEAVVNGDNVADWQGAQRLINQAIETFGDLDILVNNAGILRDRVLVNMTEEEWDAVIAVHLKGHFAPTRWAAAYWREQTKAGINKPRNVVHTSSTVGLFSNPGQANYGAAKTRHRHLQPDLRQGARPLRREEQHASRPARAPGSRWPLPGLGDIMSPKDGEFDVWDPANISPLVAYLATADCAFTGETFFVQGGNVTRVKSWEMGEKVEQNDRWTVQGLAAALAPLASPQS